MLNGLDTPLAQALLNWAGHGLWDLQWWQVLLIALALTHVTIASVTIFLHRHQAHRSLDLHPLPSHFFRFWLWMTTGMVTKEWAAIHRKHHAKCETPEDPHSPQTRGLSTVFWTGAELYRAESENAETMTKYGHGTPDDWIERNVYTRFSVLGVSLMLIIDVVLFGALGAAVWALQMAWIPVTAAGIINGIGHYWGYRNFECQDASTNISPWGILIGGEELHNNHHTYPTSAKLSVKPYEFDIGWLYIRILSALGLAHVKKRPPRIAYGDVKPADVNTLEAIIANRYEVMAGYAREVRRAARSEIAGLKAKGEQAKADALQGARRWLDRDDEKVPAAEQARMAVARATSPVLDKMLTMREELRQLWLNRSLNREQLTANLAAWCKRAEDSGIAALQEFSLRLRAARV
ncbi:MAG TPA: fatty acid desaturase [Burkholderiaceae bacterium]|nr:fatty acid desaturase [Burkholderiaceae bacterium]